MCVHVGHQKCWPKSLKPSLFLLIWHFWSDTRPDWRIVDSLYDWQWDLDFSCHTVIETTINWKEEHCLDHTAKDQIECKIMCTDFWYRKLEYCWVSHQGKTPLISMLTVEHWRNCNVLFNTKGAASFVMVSFCCKTMLGDITLVWLKCDHFFWKKNVSELIIVYAWQSKNRK